MSPIIPDRVAELIADALPEEICQAVMEAETAARNVRLCRGPLHREGLTLNLRELARANKALAAYNPGLIVRIGGELR